MIAISCKKGPDTRQTIGCSVLNILGHLSSLAINLETVSVHFKNARRVSKSPGWQHIHKGGVCVCVCGSPASVVVCGGYLWGWQA